MKNNNKYITVTTVVILLLTVVQACYKDLGNYDYIEINEVKEFRLNIVKGDYDVLMGDTLVIVTDLNFTEDADPDYDKYEYEWISYKNGAVGVGEERSKILATTKDLNIVVNLRPGIYTLYYRVKDRLTNIKWTKAVELKVTNPFGEGWLVLCDDNGTSRLDMINMIKSDSVIVYNDVLSIADSNIPQKYLNARPIGVRYLANYSFGQKNLYLLTEGGTTQLNPVDFTWQEFYDFQYEAMGDFSNDFYADDLMEGDPYVGSYTGYMRKGTDFYQYVRSQQVSYDYPLNILDGKQVDVAASIALGGTGKRSVLYDNTNKQFVMHRLGQSFCTPIQLQEGYLFDYKTGKELIYMDKQSNNLTNGEVYAVLKDPANAKYYLARFIPSTGQQTGYYEITATNFDQAEHIAISPEFPYIFYVAGGILYEYDWEDKATFEMVDYGAAGLEVTLLDFFDNAPVELDYANKLMVATYANDDFKGRLGFATVQHRNEEIIFDEEYNKLGKIISVDYAH